MQRSGSLRKCRSFIVYWQICRRKNYDVNSETLIQFNFRYKFKLWRLYTFFCFFFWFKAINLHIIEFRVKNNTMGSFTDVGSKTDYWLKFFQSKITVTVLFPSTFATKGFFVLVRIHFYLRTSHFVDLNFTSAGSDSTQMETNDSVGIAFHKVMEELGFFRKINSEWYYL